MDVIGTTLVLIASDAFDTYQSLTGGVPDANTGLLTITSEKFSKLESLFFIVNDVVCTLMDVQCGPAHFFF